MSDAPFLQATFAELHPLCLRHFAEEEAEAMPLMRRHFSQEEITKHVVAKVGRAGLQPAWRAPPRRAWHCSRAWFMSVCQYVSLWQQQC